MEREVLVPLVTRAQGGDGEAMNELFNAFYNDVYYFALKTVKDDQLACDITQEAFVEILSTLGNLKEPAAFVTWMKQITYHQCTRYFKKKKDIIAEEDEDGNTVFDTLAEENSEFIPDAALDKAELKNTVMSFLDELSEEQRAAVMMFYYDEMSIKQIAETQGVNENTVKSRLNYARKGIKASVEGYEKKNGVKLHCLGVLPILLWLFKDYFAQEVPAASAKVIAEGVASATGTAVSFSAGSSAVGTAVSAGATSGITSATATSTATSVGFGAKLAAIPLVGKIIAGTVAAAVLLGTPATVILSNRDKEESPPPDTGITETQTPSETYNNTVPENVDPSDGGDNMWVEEDPLADLDTALYHYSILLSAKDISPFASPEELTVDDAVALSAARYLNGPYYVFDMSQERADKELQNLFGKTFDLSEGTGKHSDNKEYSKYYMVLGEMDTQTHRFAPIQNADGTYSAAILIRPTVLPQAPAGDTIARYTHVSVNETTGYYVYEGFLTLTVKNEDGIWKPVSLRQGHAATDFAGYANYDADTAPYKDTDGYYYTESLQIVFYSQGITKQEADRLNMEVISQPCVYLDSGGKWRYVPMDIGDSDQYARDKQSVMNFITQYSYASIPSDVTWEELFSNEEYFRRMGGVELEGTKYIRSTSGDGGNIMETRFCYYTVNSDNSVTLTDCPLQPGYVTESAVRLTDIRFYPQNASLSVSYKYRDGHTERLDMVLLDVN